MKYKTGSITLGSKTFSAIEASPEPNLGEKEITANGEYNAEDDELEGYSKVTVEVE